jgi:hypothetical protein
MTWKVVVTSSVVRGSSGFVAGVLATGATAGL